MVLSDDDLFYYVFETWLFKSVLFTSELGGKLYRLGVLIDTIVILLLIYIIMIKQRYDGLSYVKLLLISAISILTYWTSRKNQLLILCCFLLASKEYDFEKVLKAAYKYILTGLLVVFILFKLGVVKDYVLYRNGITNRHSLGFVHPNHLGLWLFSLSACYVYSRDDGQFKYFPLIFLFFFCYFVPNSQTGFACIALLFIMICVHSYLEKNDFEKGKTNLGVILIILSLMINISSVVLCIIDTSKIGFFNVLDIYTGKRLSMSHRSYLQYGVKMFGQSIYISGGSGEVVFGQTRLWLDNAYMAILMRFGVIAYVGFTILYTFTMIRTLRKQQFMTLFILFVFAVYGIMESQFYSVAYNPFLLFISWGLFRDSDAGEYYELGYYESFQ